MKERKDESDTRRRMKRGPVKKTFSNVKKKKKGIVNETLNSE